MDRNRGSCLHIATFVSSYLPYCCLYCCQTDFVDPFHRLSKAHCCGWHGIHGNNLQCCECSSINFLDQHMLLLICFVSFESLPASSSGSTISLPDPTCTAWLPMLYGTVKYGSVRSRISSLYLQESGVSGKQIFFASHINSQ